jgi:short-subunit dehydrogenase
MNDTTGKPLAMVTGASSGIGRELAARFAEHGYDLVVAAEDERIESTAASLAGQAVQALPVRADLAAFDGVEELWQRIQGTGRVPEAVAINAGVGVAGDFTRDNDLADALRLIGLNITGAVHLARRGRSGLHDPHRSELPAPRRTCRPGLRVVVKTADRVGPDPGATAAGRRNRAVPLARRSLGPGISS